MNNRYNLNRFFDLIIWRFTMDFTAIIRSIIITASIPLLILLISILTQNTNFPIELRMMVFEWILFGTMILAPFAHYGKQNHPKKGLNSVMLPASVFEKYLEMQLFCMIILPLLFVVPYLLTDSVISIIFPTIFETSVISRLGYLFASLSWHFWLKVFITVQGVILCNLYFIRHKVLKTILAHILIPVAIFIIYLIIFRIIDPAFFTETYRFKVSFARASLMIYPDDNIFMIFAQIHRIIYYTIIPVVFVVGSYFRMKTQQY